MVRGSQWLSRDKRQNGRTIEILDVSGDEAIAFAVATRMPTRLSLSTLARRYDLIEGDGHAIQGQ